MNINILVSVNLNGCEQVNVTQMTIMSTIMDRNPLERMEQPSYSLKDSKMQ